MKRVLVIKLGALGDFAQADWAIARIREAHAEAELTLLTTSPYREWAQASGRFQRIETDGRPASATALLRMAAKLRRAGYDRVYDLQTSGRTRGYRALFWPRFPEWSGISPGASHRQTRPDRDQLHNLDRLADQLHVAGIVPAYLTGAAPRPDLGWAVRAGRAGQAAVALRFGLSPPFALLAPGASATGAAKVWPVERYGALAAELRRRGLQVGLVGGPAEAGLAQAVRAAVPDAVDLTGRTRMVELAALGAECALFVGNDTGPSHVAAYAGAPGLMLMSAVSRFGHCEPRAQMGVLQAATMEKISVAEVLQQLQTAKLIPLSVA